MRIAKRATDGRLSVADVEDGKIVGSAFYAADCPELDAVVAGLVADGVTIEEWVDAPSRYPAQGA